MDAVVLTGLEESGVRVRVVNFIQGGREVVFLLESVQEEDLGRKCDLPQVWHRFEEQLHHLLEKRKL